MAPAKSRKRPSGASVASNKPERSNTTTMKAHRIGSPQPNTPRQPSPKKSLHLTQGQKQALMDNLQLEITERARKLRAQYALQAQSLRTRLEIRVHRIPVSLRKATIAELLERDTNPEDQVKHKSLQTSAAQETSQQANLSQAGQPVVATKKRKSDQLDDNKENGAAAPQPASKKRIQSTQNRNADNPNTARRIPPSQVLSPKSNNPRTFPHSPYKPTMSPAKSAAAVRPQSPLKPSATAQRGASQTKAAENLSKPKAGPSRAASKQKTNQKAATAANKGAVKRGAGVGNTTRLVGDDQEDESHRKSNASEATNASSSTTIVRNTKKAAMPVTASTAATKGKVAGIAGKFEGISANGRKLAAPKSTSKLARPAVATTGRTLRKR